MGLLDFVKDAGEKIFNRGKESQEEADQEKAQKLAKLVKDVGVDAENLQVDFSEGRATIRGATASQAEREKIALLIGNTQGVAQVDDQIEVQKPEPAATMYTVKSGDSLSKIAKAHYGNAAKYMTIYEANVPMLKDPNKIYPGQVLRIPPQNA